MEIFHQDDLKEMKQSNAVERIFTKNVNVISLNQ